MGRLVTVVAVICLVTAVGATWAMAAPRSTTTTTTPPTTHHARDFEAVLGVARTRRGAEAMQANARRHSLDATVERDGRHGFEAEVAGFKTRTAAAREVRTARHDGFPHAFVERS